MTGDNRAMLVYVESNFALEIALAQEEGDVAEGILKLAESSEIALAIPSFALSEPTRTSVDLLQCGHNDHTHTSGTSTP